MSGNVKLTVCSKSGKGAVVGLIGPGDFFGEGCLNAPEGRPYTAAALTDCIVLRLDKTVVLDIFELRPDFCGVLIAHLLNRVSRIEADLADQIFSSSEKRLARILLLLAEFKAADESAPVPKISQETLAGMIGTTRPRVSFFLNKFRRQGLIDNRNGLVVRRELAAIIRNG